MVRGLAVLLGVAAIGCGPTDRDSSPPAPPLEPGHYRLELDNGWAWSPGPRMSLAPDGAFTGHPASTLWECSGALSSGDLIELTDALNDADALGRPDHIEPCADHEIYYFDVEATGGAARGWTSSFRYDICTDEGDPALNRAISVIAARLRRDFQAGRCTGCPIEAELADDECYGNELGVGAFCRGRVLETCDASAGGRIVDCSWTPSLECDSAAGWVPATTWSVVDAVLQRGQDSTGTLRLRLNLAVQVDHRGARPFEVHRIVDYWRLEDPATGDEIPLVVSDEHQWAGGVLSVVAPPQSSDQYSVIYDSGTDPGPSWTLPAIDIRVRERPWEGAAWSNAVPVQITQLDPP